VQILLVEDHNDTRNVLTRLLDHCGHDVSAAATVAEATSLLKEVRFDALVCDIGLPDGDGFDFVWRAKEHYRFQTAVALTALDSEKHQALGCEAGFDHYLTKPLDFAKLRDVLAQSGAQRVANEQKSVRISVG
jgi:DNA-binding response OmpR family regulator